MMGRYLAAYGAALAVMLALDLLWLGFIAKPLYQEAIGHLMADKLYLPAAIVFYGLFPLGLMIFAVAPNGAATTWGKTLLMAGLFGLFTYATYDLSNLATLRNWPASLAVIDMAWGTFISLTSAAAGKAALDHVA